MQTPIANAMLSAALKLIAESKPDEDGHCSKNCCLYFAANAGRAMAGTSFAPAATGLSEPATHRVLADVEETIEVLEKMSATLRKALNY